MDNFDKVYSYLTEEEGLSPEDASRAMVMMVEQGFDPTQVFLGGLAKLLDFLPKKKVNPVDAAAKQPPAPKPAWSSVGTTKVNPQQGPALSTKVAPAPQWGGSPQAQDIKRLNQLTKGPIGDKTIQKPVVSSGRMGKPQGPKLSTNVAPKPRFATSMTPAPKPAFNASSVVKGALNPKTLGGKLGFAGMALGAVDQAQKVFNPKDNLFTSLRDLATSVRHGGQVGPGHSRYRAPESDPALPRTPKSEPLQKVVEPVKSEPVKSEPVKSEPVKRKAPQLSAAAKDFDREFAAARARLEKQGKDPSSGVFTWRGKQYNTKLK